MAGAATLPEGPKRPMHMCLSLNFVDNTLDGHSHGKAGTGDEHVREARRGIPCNMDRSLLMIEQCPCIISTISCLKPNRPLALDPHPDT